MDGIPRPQQPSESESLLITPYFSVETKLINDENCRISVSVHDIKKEVEKKWQAKVDELTQQLVAERDKTDSLQKRIRTLEDQLKEHQDVEASLRFTIEQLRNKEADSRNLIEENTSLREQLKILEKIEVELKERIRRLTDELENCMAEKDKLAKKASKTKYSSLEELIEALIKDADSDYDKCRAIFLWLVKLNLKNTTFDQVERRSSLEDLLMDLKRKRTSYATVFDAMCRCAGLHSEVIEGLTKGDTYRPGTKFQPGTPIYSWNAVTIGSQLGLIDVERAARRFSFSNQVEEFFFMPDPHQLIYSHFPNDSYWQFLPSPMTQNQFENMPVLRPPYFTNGLQLLDHKTAVVTTKTNEITFRIGCQSDATAYVFAYILTSENDVGQYQRAIMRTDGIHYNAQGEASLKIHLPQHGTYFLSILIKESEHENGRHICFEQVCEFKLVYEKVETPRIIPPTPQIWVPAPKPQPEMEKYMYTMTARGLWKPN